MSRQLENDALLAAMALGNNEALFLPNECVIARSGTGRLWFGSQWGDWYRGDAIALLGEYLHSFLHAADTHPYVRTDTRKSLPYCLKPVEVAGVGRRSFHPVRKVSS